MKRKIECYALDDHGDVWNYRSVGDIWKWMKLDPLPEDNE